jgi:hypothetical protein
VGGVCGAVLSLVVVMIALFRVRRRRMVASASSSCQGVSSAGVVPSTPADVAARLQQRGSGPQISRVSATLSKQYLVLVELIRRVTFLCFDLLHLLLWITAAAASQWQRARGSVAT